MAIRVLIVDDSTFFRKRLNEIIKGDPALEVCGEARDGKEGVEMAARLKPDVITMDVEMPVMDGITAVKEIMAKSPTPIMPKNFDDIAHRREDALAELRGNIKAVARSRVSRRSASPSPMARTAASPVTQAVPLSRQPAAPRPALSTPPLRTSAAARPAAPQTPRFGSAPSNAGLGAFARGTGNLLEPLPVDLSAYRLAVVKPPLFVSTADAFRGVTPRPAPVSLRRFVAEKPVGEWRGALRNDFEDSLFPRFPLLAGTKEKLYADGALYASMTGSGSAFFALYPPASSPEGKDALLRSRLSALFPGFFVWTDEPLD